MHARMSFDETVYQYLSGAKLPISKLEDNLKFVKKLREDGVINYLELATVLQEANFREMPQFTERCLNEFGADIVRIRPIMPGGRLDKNIQWFMDVRNPKHPYYEDYCNVMRHPVFQNPKVLLWSGELPSTRGEHPGIKSTQIQKLSDYILNQQDIIKLLKEIANVDELPEIDIYGGGTIGKLLVRILEGDITVHAIYDSYTQMNCFGGGSGEKTL